MNYSISDTSSLKVRKCDKNIAKKARITELLFHILQCIKSIIISGPIQPNKKVYSSMQHKLQITPFIWCNITIHCHKGGHRILTCQYFPKPIFS